jgi:pyruvate formate lyase activating enzyme
MKKMTENNKPLIVNINQNSLDDGPGIRSVIFFKGCPLSCVWCQNPETQNIGFEIKYQKENCIKCQNCTVKCPTNAFNMKNEPFFDFSLCNHCFNCLKSCPAQVFEQVGKYYEIDELMKNFISNKPFYKNSGGGVTLSGGEPLLFPNYIDILVDRLHKEEISIVLETCGYFKIDDKLIQILKKIDIIYFDIKIMDSALHKDSCGIDNRLILHNFKKLIEDEIVSLPMNKEILKALEIGPKKPYLIPRTPLIPKLTTHKKNLKSIDELYKKYNIRLIGLLEYNPLWEKKSEELGKKVDYHHNSWMGADKIKEMMSFFNDYTII